MQTIPFTEANGWFARLMDVATRDREPITITRSNESNVVIVAADDYAAMEETLYLLSTPANATRIQRGLADYAAGKLQPGELCD